MSPKFFFIGGVGRCGTSITRELLSTHRQVITFPFEYRFIIDPDGVIDFIESYSKNWSPYGADRKIKRLENFLTKIGKKNTLEHILGALIKFSPFLSSKINANSYHGWNLSHHFPGYFSHVANLIDSLEEFSYSGTWAGAESFRVKNRIRYSGPKSEEELYVLFRVFFKELFNDLFKKHDKNILVEDNTWNLLFCKELSQLFPNAKFIHVYRDPRDVVCSYLRQRWMPGNKVQAATICRDLYHRIKSNLHDFDSEAVLQFSLEDFVKDKDTVLDEFALFSELEIVDEMRNFTLSSSSIGRWKSELTKRELAELAPYLKETTESLGYEW